VRKALLRLIAGIVRIRLPSDRPWNRFDVVTPTAIASVRSTDWIIEAARDTSAVFCAQGSVTVRNRSIGGEVVLEPGFGTDVARSAPPTPVKRWGQKRVDSAVARTALP